MPVYAGIVKFSIIEILISDRIDKRIESFIHPRVFAFIAAYNHREPGMAEFMTRDSPKSLSLVPAGTKYNSRIFHPTYNACNIGCYRIWIGVPLFRIMFQAPFYECCGAFPSGIQGTFNRINRHSQGLFAIW